MSNSRADRTSYKLRPCPRQDYSERRYRELQIGHELTTTEDQDTTHTRIRNHSRGDGTVSGGYCRTCAIPEGARTASRRATSTRGRRATQSSRATTRIPEGTGAAKRGKTKTRRRRATQVGGASKGITIAGATSTPTGGRVGGCKRSS